MPDKLSVLLDVWRQSRSDLQTSQDRFRNTIYIFLVASFGITAFLIGEKNTLTFSGPQLAAITDIVLLLVFSLLIRISFSEFRLNRLTVESYEDQLKRGVNHPRSLASVKLFPSFNGDQKPRMTLRNELLVAGVALVVVVIKAILLTALSDSVNK